MRTGRFRFIPGFRGRQMLEVEVTGRAYNGVAELLWVPGEPSDAATIMQRLNGTTAQPPEQSWEDFRSSLWLYMD